MSRRPQREREPRTYLSASEGRFRVIDQGMPISPDKRTANEAIAAARQFNIRIASKMWDGDRGEWVDLPSEYARDSGRWTRSSRDSQPKYRDYEYIVYPEPRVAGEGRKIPMRRKRGVLDVWDLTEAKRVARELGYPAGIYSVSKGRFIGYIGRSGRFVPIR